MVSDVLGAREPAPSAQLAEESQNRKLVIGRDQPRCRLGITELRRCVDEHATAEVLLLEPLLVKIEYRQEAFPRPDLVLRCTPDLEALSSGPNVAYEVEWILGDCSGQRREGFQGGDDCRRCQAISPSPKR